MGEKEKSTLHTHRLSRRDLLLQAGVLGLLKIFDPTELFALPAEAQAAQPGTPASPASSVLSPEDDALLDELEKRNFQFFWEQAGAQTGLIKDRCNLQKNDTSVVASIAATGFGLTALCVAEKRGYISSSAARDRVLFTLRFL